jgi:hypothetical protein
MGLRMENNTYEYQKIISEKNKETTFGGHGREDYTVENTLLKKSNQKVKEIDLSNR